MRNPVYCPSQQNKANNNIPASKIKPVITLVIISVPLSWVVCGCVELLCMLREVSWFPCSSLTQETCSVTTCNKLQLKMFLIILIVGINCPYSSLFCIIHSVYLLSFRVLQEKTIFKVPLSVFYKSVIFAFCLLPIFVLWLFWFDVCTCMLLWI